MELRGGLLTYGDPGRKKGGPQGEMEEERKEKRGTERERGRGRERDTQRYFKSITF